MDSQQLYSRLLSWQLYDCRKVNPVSPQEYRPTFAQLRTFATIAETGHFRSAAAQLGISQPSLSQALAALEAGLGTQLIERSTRRVIVTPIGRSLLPYAKKTIDSLESFVTHARGVHTGLVGAMRIGMIPTIAPYLLPDFLRAIPNNAEDLEPQIVEGKTTTVIEALRQGRVDVALIATDESAQGLSTIELYNEEFVLVVPADHPLAGKRDVRLQEIENLDLLLLDEGHCLRDQVLDLCRTVNGANSLHHNATRAAGLTTIVQMVAAGLGCTLLPLSAVEAECQRPGVAIATIKGAANVASRTVYLAHRPSSARVDDYVALGGILDLTYREVIRRCREVVDGNLS